MEWLDLNTIGLFALFILPGFISTKVFRLFYPAKEEELSNAIINLISYSLINAAITFFPIHKALENGWDKNHPIWFYLLLVFALLVFPIVLPIIYKAIVTSSWLGKYVIHPSPTPWDYFFGKKEPVWVIVHLKDGRKIGGLYFTNSFASSYPHDEQIYLERVVKIEADGRFGEKTPFTKGILIGKDEWQFLEFFGTENE